MTEFWRNGHWRISANGILHWVDGHSVERKGASGLPPAPSPGLNGGDLLVYGVSETRSAACFVNPNATCPVFKERVFYYQNSYGSRVYFDDLGWPWTKHYCLNKKFERIKNPQATLPTFPNERRGWLISQNLLRLAREQNITFTRILNSDGWRSIIVTSVDIFDNKTDIFVSFLEEIRLAGRFLYDGTSPFLKVNSLISHKDDCISLPDAKTLEPTTFKVKWRR